MGHKKLSNKEQPIHGEVKKKESTTLFSEENQDHFPSYSKTNPREFFKHNKQKIVSKKMIN